jgi:uncharacterized protein (TIGR03089 family)
MRIIGLSARPPQAKDVATALSGAVSLLGQRPAITALGPGGRREQGFASLAGWVAKGANLLRLELDLGPGARVAVAGPPGWPLAAVTLSAWWIGATVVPAGAADAGTADASVLHVGSVVPSAAGGERFWFGDALDGTGTPPGGADRGEQWTDAVTPHGDRPPAPAHDGGLVALTGHGGADVTQRAMLSQLEEESGVLAIARTGDEDVLTRSDAVALLAALALRPLVTGAATVVIGHDDPERDAQAEAERITRWYA